MEFLSLGSFKFSILGCIAILIVIVNLIIGILKGFTSKIGSIICGIVCLPLAYYVATPLNELIYEQGWYSTDSLWIYYLILVGVIIVCYFLFFILFKIIIKLIKKLISSIKIFKIIDRILGGLLGVAQGFLFSVFIFALIAFIGGYVEEVNNFYIQDIADSLCIGTIFDSCGEYVLEFLHGIVGGGNA